MIILDNVQGTTEWIAARLWRLTSSEMKGVITSKGSLSKSITATKHIDKLIAGIDLANALQRESEKVDAMDDWQLKNYMADYTGDKFKGSVHTLRGHEMEPEAIALLSERLGKQVQPVGMCLLGDNKNSVVSCSTDGLIYDSSGEIEAPCEVKSPSLCNLYTYICNDVLPEEYKLQVHASMAICETEQAHFAAYFKGMPLFYKEVHRDSFTDKLETSLHEFRSVYEQRYQEVYHKLGELKSAREESII